MTDVKVSCNHCGWSVKVKPDPITWQNWGTRGWDTKLPALLKKAWSMGLDHAWDNKGHVVETFVDGKLKATQQVAEMNAWKDHRSLVVEEGT